MSAEQLCASYEPRRSIRVALLFDVRLFREGIAELLRANANLDVTGIYESLGEALPDFHERAPDVLLLDASQAEGLRVAISVRALHPSIEIVALNVGDESHHIIACAEAGVSGFLARCASPTELGQAVLDAVRGEFRCSTRIAANLLEHVHTLASSARTNHEPTRLTRRELEVAHLIDLGLSNKEIAIRLCIGLSTVKNHVHKVLEKANARRRGEAAARLRPVLLELRRA